MNFASISPGVPFYKVDTALGTFTKVHGIAPEPHLQGLWDVIYQSGIALDLQTGKLVRIPLDEIVVEVGRDTL